MKLITDKDYLKNGKAVDVPEAVSLSVLAPNVSFIDVRVTMLF